MQGIELVGPAGGVFTVKTEGERAMFLDLVDRYNEDNSFQNISDLQDLERIIYLEVLSLRYANWLSLEQDYDGEMVDARDVSGVIKDFSNELRQLKKSIGIDRATRLKDDNESVSGWIEKLKMRAHHFGIHRENQLTNALTLFHDLAAKMTLRENCTPEEARALDVRDEDVLLWIDEIMIPSYRDIDDYFRKNDQKFWIEDQ